MNGKAKSEARGMGKSRIEALNVGTFAAAMALLAVPAVVPGRIDRLKRGEIDGNERAL